ncbi:fic/DOC family protein [Colletotrichum plurivorum]|uniref:Fic/DOC family protein n=1 Tax=Colletotrichum plurivorum TaxID=2175906 RepID=A0A8H6KI76_9PEZI|nr:fic/DOC family protein [Colletotrichum plurivorum]
MPNYFSVQIQAYACKPTPKVYRDVQKEVLSTKQQSRRALVARIYEPVFKLPNVLLNTEGSRRKEQQIGLVEMVSLISYELSGLKIPQATPHESAKVEVKNHIVTLLYGTENAATRLGTAGVSKTEARDLAAITAKGTASEDAYREVQSGRTSLGVQVLSSPSRRLPLTAYFVNIYPFPDAGGRTSRLITQDNMIRQGYLPVVLQELERGNYMRMINNACDG